MGIKIPLQNIATQEFKTQQSNLNFFFCKLTYVLKENDTKNIMGIPKIYNVNRNETNKWLQASHITKQKFRPTRYARGTKIIS